MDSNNKNEIDRGWVGIIDAKKSGWYNNETGELVSGFFVNAEDTVLDVGCGAGLATMFCAKRGAHIVFTDIEADKVDSLKERALKSDARKVEAIVSDSIPLPIEDGYATKILAMEMLEHTENPEKILQELVRVGKPGAQYLITVPAEASELLQKPFAHPSYFAKPNHIQIYDEARFRSLIEGAGLQIQHYSRWGFYWTMFMSILWCTQTDNDDNSESLGMVAPPYDPALIMWSKMWQEFLKRKELRPMIESFNKTLPKAQAIIARKKG